MCVSQVSSLQNRRAVGFDLSGVIIIRAICAQKQITIKSYAHGYKANSFGYLLWPATVSLSLFLSLDINWRHTWNVAPGFRLRVLVVLLRYIAGRLMSMLAARRRRHRRRRERALRCCRWYASFFLPSFEPVRESIFADYALRWRRCAACGEGNTAHRCRRRCCCLSKIELNAEIGFLRVPCRSRICEYLCVCIFMCVYILYSVRYILCLARLYLHAVVWAWLQSAISAAVVGWNCCRNSRA